MQQRREFSGEFIQYRDLLSGKGKESVWQAAINPASLLLFSNKIKIKKSNSLYYDFECKETILMLIYSNR